MNSFFFNFHSCLWNITAIENQKIKLKFLSPVILQENSDKLIIFNGEKVIKKLTGYIQYPKEYESVSNYMYIELDSFAHGHSREGFLAQVSII